MRWLRRSALVLLATALAGVATPAVIAVAPAGAAMPMPACQAGPGWPMVGADLANTRSVAGGPSASAAKTLQVAWRFHATNGDFTGTPVIHDCMVFVGSNGGSVRALQEGTGHLVWQAQLGAGPIPSSAAVSGGQVFVAVAAAGHPAVAALDEATGALLWTTTIDRQNHSDAYGSPVVADGVVYEGVAGVVDAEVTDPSINVRGGLVALDAHTGRVLWHTYTVPPGDDGGGIWSSPSLDPMTGLLYVGDGNAYHAPAAATTDSLLVIRASTGMIIRHFQATNGDVFGGLTKLTGPDLDFGASPNLVTLPDGTVAVGIGQKAAVYWMFRRSDLTPIWHTQLGIGDAFGGVIGATAVDQRGVYGPNTVPGYTWGLQQQGGRLLWLNPGLDAMHYGPVSVSNGVVYTEDSLGFLDAVTASMGSFVDRIPLNPIPASSYAQAYGGVSIADGMVFADTGSQQSAGDVIALRPGGGLLGLGL
jgi:polyvinyl alcohol dehydrogenase (cytochrome)